MRDAEDPALEALLAARQMDPEPFAQVLAHGVRLDALGRQNGRYRVARHPLVGEEPEVHGLDSRAHRAGPVVVRRDAGLEPIREEEIEGHIQGTDQGGGAGVGRGPLAE